jgi:hypothetical protein
MRTRGMARQSRRTGREDGVTSQEDDEATRAMQPVPSVLLRNRLRASLQKLVGLPARHRLRALREADFACNAFAEIV